MIKLLKTILFIIFIQFYCLIIFANGENNNWVYLDISDNTSTYYNLSSGKIDYENKTIYILTKKTFSEKGKKEAINILKKGNQNIVEKLIYMEYVLEPIIIDYRGHMFQIEQTTIYSKSDEILESYKYQPLWSDILPDSTIDKLLSKLIKVYNIRK